MGGSSSIMKPQELSEFRKLNTTTENVEIPARPSSRALTDKKGFVMFGIAVLIFLPFYGYSMAKTDLRRITHGYDNCGNMCGYKNSIKEGVKCSGADYTRKRFFSTDGELSNIEELFGGNYTFSRCLEKCPGRQTSNFMKKCGYIEGKYTSDASDDHFYNDTFDDLNYEFNSSRDGQINEALAYCRGHWWKFVVSILITIALCSVVLLLLRFFPELIVWGVLIAGMAVAVILTCYLWYLYFRDHAFIAGAIIFTIITVVVIIVFICLFKKIRLVVQLYKEATKAIFAMPHILLIPVLIALLQLIVTVVFLTSTLYMITSREFYKITEKYYQYDMNGVMKFTIIFNLIMTSLTMHFIAGFQYMVIAGSIAAWYFARNKQYLDSPILTSFVNTLKFHIGSIAFGSFILTVMDIIRAMIRSINNDKVRWILECCCSNIDAFLKFLSKNAYIETAIHGQSFLRSGRRAAKLLLTNASSVIAINSVGDFVLGVIVFALIIASTLISSLFFRGNQHFWLASIICFIINCIIIALTFAIFETTIDTLFICFCEDKVINDGLSKPYFMSRGLMEFVEDSKKIYGSKD